MDVFVNDVTDKNNNATILSLWLGKLLFLYPWDWLFCIIFFIIFSLPLLSSSGRNDTMYANFIFRRVNKTLDGRVFWKWSKPILECFEMMIHVCLHIHVLVCTLPVHTWRFFQTFNSRQRVLFGKCSLVFLPKCVIFLIFCRGRFVKASFETYYHSMSPVAVFEMKRT